MIDGDGVYDLGDVNDHFVVGSQRIDAGSRTHPIAGRLHGAELAAAHRGELRGPLAVGLVYDLNGQVMIDPDEQVRTAVEDLLAEFARTGSAYGARPPREAWRCVRASSTAGWRWTTKSPNATSARIGPLAAPTAD
jgi:hypothetical protein